ncbi:hypothetical protein STEG23_014329, partial [Scotinomys teguina]
MLLHHTGSIKDAFTSRHQEVVLRTPLPHSQDVSSVIDIVTLDLSATLWPSGEHYRIPLPSLQLNFRSSAWGLTVDLCICFHQLLDEGSMVTGYLPIWLL